MARCSACISRIRRACNIYKLCQCRQQQRSSSSQRHLLAVRLLLLVVIGSDATRLSSVLRPIDLSASVVVRPTALRNDNIKTAKNWSREMRVARVRVQGRYLFIIISSIPFLTAFYFSQTLTINRNKLCIVYIGRRFHFWWRHPKPGSIGGESERELWVWIVWGSEDRVLRSQGPAQLLAIQLLLYAVDLHVRKPSFRSTDHLAVLYLY